MAEIIGGDPTALAGTVMRQQAEAHPATARRLIELFCVTVETGRITANDPAAGAVLEYVREALRAYLDERRPGRRKAIDAETHKPLERPDPMSGKPHQYLEPMPIGDIATAFGLKLRPGTPRRRDRQAMIDS